MNGDPGGCVLLDRDEAGDRETVLVALGPRPVAATVGVHQPLAEGSDHGHATARIAVRENLCCGESKKRRSFADMMGFLIAAASRSCRVSIPRPLSVTVTESSAWRITVQWP